MKKRILLRKLDSSGLAFAKVLALSILLAMAFPISGGAAEEPEEPCVEEGPHYGEWTLNYCPSVTNSPGVSPSTLCAEVGQAPTTPTVTPPEYQSGQKQRTIEWDCPTTNATVEYASISYSVGGVQWDPELPSAVSNSFSSTAYVEVTSSDPELCPDPGRVDIGTASWVVSCNYSHSTTNCSPGSVTHGTPSGSTNVCLGTGVSASVSANYSNAVQIITMLYTNACGNIDTNNCPPSHVTNNIPPTVVSNWWTGSVGSFSASGSGLSASMSPTNCGDGTITFYTKWTNGCEEDETTTSSSVGVKVSNVEIVPGSDSAKINKCEDPNRSVTFSLTNTCGEVTWSIDPAGVTDGASIAGGVVTIGDVVTNYTIKAVSNDNTNCYDTASLAVTRDCVCTNHTIAASSQAPDMGGSGSCRPADTWVGDVHTTKCNKTAQLRCDGFVKLLIDGSVIGHCPYDLSWWWGEFWPCQCGDVIMKARFQVINRNANTNSTFNGKTEIWTCENGAEGANCWTSPTNTAAYGPQTPRACDGDDSLIP